MTIFKIPATNDTYVVGDKNIDTQCHSPYLPVGILNMGFCAARIISYLYFDLSVVPKDATVLSAEVILYFSDPPYEGKPPSVIGLKGLAKCFADCYTNYRNRPPTLSHTSKLVQVKDHHTLTIEVSSLVKAWLNKPYFNYGLALLPVNLHSSGILKFYSSDYPEAVFHPTLNINILEACPTPCTDDLEETRLVVEAEEYSAPREVWQYSVFSFIVRNIGVSEIKAKLQCSPDGITFIDEEPEYVLAPGQTHIFVSNFFTRYARIKFKLVPGETKIGKIRIWLQGRQ